MSERSRTRRIASGALRIAPALALAILFLLLAAASWRRTGDVLVDWGRELYTAWRLSSGAVLYADVDSLFGPLSPYLNALLFRVFGVSITTLLVANLSLVAVSTLLLYRLFRDLGDRATATLVAATFLVGFAFSHLTLNGSLNFVSPYAHQATHGVILSVLGIVCLQRYLETGTLRWAASVGVAFGAIFLTKTEITLAAVGGLGAGWLLIGITKAIPNWRRGLAACLGGSVIAPSLFIGLFLLQGQPFRKAAQGTVAGWIRLADAGGWASFYYRSGFLGDGLGASLTAMGLTLTAVLAAVVAIVAVDRATVFGPAGRPLRIGLPLMIGLGLLSGLSTLPWLALSRPLPVVALAAVVWFGRASTRDGDSGGGVRRNVILASWAGFALLLLGRNLLFSRFDHYGFYLAMPATILAVHLAAHELPRQLARRSAAGRLTRSCLIVGTVVFGVFLAVRSFAHYSRKTYAIGRGTDMMLAFPPHIDARSDEVTTVLTALRRFHDPGSTLAVFPEGVMLNYLERWPNPTAYTSFVPVELRVHGEQTVLAALRHRPPDVAVITGRDLSAYGVDRFGSPGGGSRIEAWLREHYDAVAAISPSATGHLAQGMEILRRSPP